MSRTLWGQAKQNFVVHTHKHSKNSEATHEKSITWSNLLYFEKPMKHLQERLTHYFKLIQLIFDIVKLTYSNSKNVVLKSWKGHLADSWRFLQSATYCYWNSKFFLSKTFAFWKIHWVHIQNIEKKTEMRIENYFWTICILLTWTFGIKIQKVSQDFKFYSTFSFCTDLNLGSTIYFKITKFVLIS